MRTKTSSSTITVKRNQCVYQCELSSIILNMNLQVNIIHASFRVVSESATGEHQGIKQVLATTID